MNYSYGLELTYGAWKINIHARPPRFKPRSILEDDNRGAPSERASHAYFQPSRDLASIWLVKPKSDMSLGKEVLTNPKTTARGLDAVWEMEDKLITRLKRFENAESP